MSSQGDKKQESKQEPKAASCWSNLCCFFCKKPKKQAPAAHPHPLAVRTSVELEFYNLSIHGKRLNTPDMRSCRYSEAETRDAPADSGSNLLNK